MKTTEELHREIRRTSQPDALSGADYSTPSLTEYLAELLHRHGTTVREVIHNTPHFALK